ncbi:MAG: hypothetical protein JXJ04_01350 [Spirochaetales bacterium]|nr:hypothetical protein [Spirochaetales bacterium]
MMEFLENISSFVSDLFYTIVHGISRFRKLIGDLFKNIKKRHKESRFHLRDFNLYRRIRESSVRFYLERTITFHKKTSIITWQPLLFVLAKLGAGIVLSLSFFSLYPYLATYIKELILFFRLNEIYNFDFPTTTFIESIARAILLIILGYIGIFYVKYQFEALFSALVISTTDKKVYYIKNALIMKELFIFSMPEIDLVVLKQNILTRLLGIGTILLQKKSGEQVIIASIKNPSKIFLHLTSLTGCGQKEMRG